MSYSTEVIRRIYDDEEGVCLEVGSCQYGNPGIVSISTQGKKNEEWYGKLYVGISPGQARLLADALSERADEAEGETDK